LSTCQDAAVAHNLPIGSRDPTARTIAMKSYQADSCQDNLKSPQVLLFVEGLVLSLCDFPCACTESEREHCEPCKKSFHFS